MTRRKSVVEAEADERPRPYIEVEYHLEEDGSTLPVLWFCFRDDVIAVPAEPSSAEEVLHLLLEMLDEPCARLVYEEPAWLDHEAERSEAEAEA